MMTTPLANALRIHARDVPEQSGLADDYLKLLGEGVHAFVRERREGHFTGSAWLVSRDGKNVLLTHHRKLDRWLQLGGHADGDMDLRAVALKEAEEESGLAGLSVDEAIFDLDTHWIPERGDVPGHWHHDVRYVVHAGDDEAFAVSDESNALAWRGIAEIANDPSADASLRRMAQRWSEQHAGA
ncbi:MAG: NUDIX hydrolase [Xanthomonadales bacterium]|nr:NUDIX hydrolase [Xanthomonadales bacterium]